MLEISEIKIENTSKDCITDNLSPVVSFALQSDVNGCALQSAVITVANVSKTVTKQTGICLENLPLKPFCDYTVKIQATDNFGNTAVRVVHFQTGRLETDWNAKWITLKDYAFPKNTSPKPFTFVKNFKVSKKIRRAFVTVTAIGIYELNLNGRKVGNDYFAPGLTSYRNALQYQLYDVTDMLTESNELVAVIGGGWAVGRFTYGSKSKITSDRQSFIAELFIEYENGETEKIITDRTWRATLEGNYKFGDFYDGEAFDATVDLREVEYKSSDVCRPKIKPRLLSTYGALVKAHETLIPVESFAAKNGEIIYDFGQNFAGVVYLKINGKHGQKITVRHSETIWQGDLCVNSLRTAKATATYICKEGEQEYSPRLTYMGFRYIGVSGISPDNVTVKALALYSDIEQTGIFECSNELLNKLQNNVVWSGKSNFVDIPTDCPQRDERMGWTGDIAVFASTACYNFDLSRFFNKWLKDVAYEQGRGGGIPFVVPKQGLNVPTFAAACWGDCCVIVPWAEYLARGDEQLLKRQYPSMKRFVKAAKFWSGLFSAGKRRYIWKGLFQFGDWCAPGNGTDLKSWFKRGKWIATAYFANSCNIVSQAATILGKDKDAQKYAAMYAKICAAYKDVFTDGNGRLKNEFQAAYVLPLHFKMESDKTAACNMAQNLARLLQENGYCLSTGFPATPYILFALADNGQADVAYKVLLQEKCPSWVYNVTHGGTTFWEQWDAVHENVDTFGGRHCVSDNSVSFNHYAYGAVGDFLYKRVLGLEPLAGGYKRFRVQPVLGGGLSFAKGSLKTPYGEIRAEWNIADGKLTLDVQVPVSCECQVTLPNGENTTVSSGQHSFTIEIQEIL